MLSPEAERYEDRRVERLKNRQFYHSKTYQPISLEQVMSDVDSDNEDDDFADIEERRRLDRRLVNVSEEDKRFMWLWNTFVRKQTVVADKHVPWACERFVKLHVKELISPHGFNQWRIFMVKLWKHGLVCAKTINKCNTILDNAQQEEEAAAAAASTSQATTANGNEQQAPMELDAE